MVNQFTKLKSRIQEGSALRLAITILLSHILVSIFTIL